MQGRVEVGVFLWCVSCAAALRSPAVSTRGCLEWALGRLGVHTELRMSLLVLSVSVQSRHDSGAQTSAPGWWCRGEWLCLPHTDPNLACPMAELVWSGSCCLPGPCRLSSCVVPTPRMSVCEGQDSQAWGCGCGQSCSLACVCWAVAWPVRLCLPPALCPLNQGCPLPPGPAHVCLIQLAGHWCSCVTFSCGVQCGSWPTHGG